MSDSKELQTKQETPLIPMSQIDQSAMYGEMDSTDIVIPTLVVLEGMSEEVKTHKLGHPGDLFLRVLNRNLGEGPVEVIPLRRFKTRLRREVKRDKTGNVSKDMNAPILCRSVDGKFGVGEPGGDCTVCPHTQWNGTNSPECSDFQNMLCLLRGEEVFPVVISGGRTRLKALKSWNTLLTMEQLANRPLFCKSYNVRPATHSSANGESHTFAITVANDNKLLSQEEQQLAHSWFLRLLGRNIEVQDEQPAAEKPETEKF
jgi:hypothetical protein